MSQLFTSDGKDLWWPATTVARLFFRTAEAMTTVTGRPHGIRDLGWDEYDIDLPIYQEFVEELARRYLATGHAVLGSLIEGFLPTSLALLRKAGGDAPLLAEAAAEQTSTRPDTAAKARRLLALTDDLTGRI